MTPFLRTVAWLPVFLAAAAPAAAHFGAQPPKDVYLAKRIAEIRDATARFQDPAAARAAGYVQASGNLPLLGYRFAQPGITAVAFDRPTALFYLKQGERWQLAGVEYAVAGEGRPAVEPFPGIRWTWEPAVCRYADWHELQEPARDRCPATHPEGAALAAWQPAYWSIRVWVWYLNPSGMFARVNPLLAPFDDHSLPPSGFWTWDAWAKDAEYSNRNHHVAGWIVLAMAIGVLILLFSDPEGWPVGNLTLAQSLASEEVREHKLSGVIVLALGLVEFLRLRGALRSRVCGLFLPVLSIGAGAILLQHQHAVSNFGYLGRANLPHVTEGLTATLIGVTKILTGWGLWRGRAAAVAWPALTLALALQLVLYTE